MYFSFVLCVLLYLFSYNVLVRNWKNVFNNSINDRFGNYRSTLWALRKHIYKGIDQSSTVITRRLEIHIRIVHMGIFNGRHEDTRERSFGLWGLHNNFQLNFANETAARRAPSKRKTAAISEQDHKSEDILRCSFGYSSPSSEKGFVVLRLLQLPLFLIYNNSLSLSLLPYMYGKGIPQTPLVVGD